MTKELAFPKPHRERLGGDAYKELIRKVFERDRWACRNPGCGSGRNLQAHHVIKRSQLGNDQMGNLITLCAFCHDRIERNELKIEIIDVVVRFKEVKK